MRKSYVKVLIVGAIALLTSYNVASIIYRNQNPKIETINLGSDPWNDFAAGALSLEGRSRHEKLKQKLDHFSAQYNWPKTLPYGWSTELIFVIEGDKRGSADDLIKSFAGSPITTEIMSADQMSATLTAPKSDAEITPRTPELQAVTTLNFTKWIWDVQPKRTGSVILTLDVYAHLRLTDKAQTSPNEVVSILPTRRIRIPVTVTPWDQTKIYLDQIDPVWKTLAGLVSGIGAVLLYFGWPKKKANTDVPV